MSKAKTEAKREKTKERMVALLDSVLVLDARIRTTMEERDTYKRALEIAEKLGELCAPASSYIEQAKEEIARERRGND